MKKRYLAITLGIMLSVSSSLAACGTASASTMSASSSANADENVNTSSQSSDQSSEDTVEGEVASVDGDTVTVNIGTADSDDSQDLTLTGETKDVTVTDDTTYEYQMGGAPSGDAPSGGPSSDNNSSDSSNGSSDNSSSGSSDSQPPAKPDNSSSDDSGSGSSDNQPPAMPNDSSSGNSSGSSNSQPPAKPDDSSSDSTDSGSSTDSSNSVNSSSGSSSDSNSNGNAPSGEAPSGDMPSGGAPSGMGGQQEASLDSLTEGTHVIITLNDDGTAKTVTIVQSMGNGMPGGQGGGQSSADVTYSSDNEISEDGSLSDQTIDSTGTDEEAILVDNGATASLSGLTINRTSSDSTGGDNSSFYGVGASVLTTGGTTYLKDSTITSDAKGGAGVFSYGDGVTYVADTTIDTSQDTSGGIHVAGGGKLYAWDVTATTAGESSAAIRSDRGGGTMVVDGGSYTSNGTGSPAVYSTADITVHDADLTANNSEAVCIEGLNTLRLFDCNLTGNMPDDNEQNDCTWNVILYQSMSGDSEEGNSTFEMVGGTLTAKDGGMFYTTNTESTFILDNVDITYADDNDFFLKCTGNSNARGWGSSGSNGADCNFTAIDQEMEGDILWDSISKLDFYMTGNSTLKGAITDDESNAGDGGDGYCNLYIENGSTWTVTGDSTLTNLYNAGTIVDEDGNTVSIVGTDGTTYVEGDSQYTITVDSYSTDVDLSGAATADSWETYETAKPSELS